jgi:hypothetical protein
MRRSLLILLVMTLAGVAVFVAGHRVAGRLCSTHFSRPTDDLDWLRMEFRLNDAEMARIRQLHEGYLPKCQSYCDRIATKQGELRELTGGGTNVPAAVEQKLGEIAALRAQCQAEMLRHFAEISQAMPAEQGRRYLTEMQRLTLGFHEQIEKSMSPESSASHGHH